MLRIATINQGNHKGRTQLVAVWRCPPAGEVTELNYTAAV